MSTVPFSKALSSIYFPPLCGVNWALDGSCLGANQLQGSAGSGGTHFVAGSIGAADIASSTLRGGANYVATSGTNTITGSLSPAPSSYTTGMQVVIVPASNNTGAATLNLNGLGAKSITKTNGASALTGSELVAGNPAILVYNGTAFVLTTYPQVFLPQVMAVGGTTSGTNTYTLASSPNPGPLGSSNVGLVVSAVFTNANTGAATLNLNGSGAKAIKKAVSSDLAAADITAGSTRILVWDGTNFQLVNVA